MTKKTQLKHHLQSLEKIGSIMAAMRNFAFIEMNKVSKFLETQEQAHSLINKMGNDFLVSYPEYFSQLHVKEPEIFILIGSERGFCGNFNENISDYLKNNHSPHIQYIVIGKKLAEKLGANEAIIQVLQGPNTIGEISDIIFNLLNKLTLSITNLRPNTWRIIFPISPSSGVITL